MKHLLLLFICIFIATKINAQADAIVLSKNATDSLINDYCKVLKDNYFDKTLTKEITITLQKKLKAGDFYNKTQITDRLSLLIREITKDNHFYIGFNQPKISTVNNELNNESVEEENNENGGFSEVLIIDKNIGYIKWDAFIANEESFQKAIAALQFLKGCKHLIFDLSECPGGDGQISGFMNSHLFESIDYQNLLRKKCTGENQWRESEVPYNYTNGPKFYDIPIYVIVSEHTASSAEYFALIIKEMKRGMILGETTAGAGNPSKIVSFGKYFAMIPICQIETRDGKSIEGKGVAPNVKLTSKDWIKETVDYIKSTHK